MINLYCTQKLIAKLPVKEGRLPDADRMQYKEIQPENKEGVVNPLSDWHGNLLTLQRRNCVLMVHNETRFPLLLIGLTKPDFADLDYLFADALMNTLLKLGANEAQMDAASALVSPLNIAKAHDRSVQGTLNQMKGDIEHLLRFNNTEIMDCSPYRLSAWLADRPCSVKSREPGAPKSRKDCIWPVEDFLALLGGQNIN